MTNERRKEIRRKRKKRNRGKNRLIVWFKCLSRKKKIFLAIGIVLIMLLISLAVFVTSKFAKLDREEISKEDIVINDFVEDDVGVGYTNFVLFGGDSRTGDVDKNLNTDSIIVVSLNNETKEVKMVSVYRDTLLDVSNGSIKKCNSAYGLGGAKQAINMLNQNLDLNIQQYVTVDFGAVANVIDMLGGIEIDVSKAEMNAVNKYIWETAAVAGKAANALKRSGVQTLDGVQATTYARIRKGVGDDYARTERQRLVIQKTFEKALKADFATLNKIIDKVLPTVSTNLTMTEILGYAKSIMKYKIGETTGFPFEKGSGTVPGRGSCVFPITLKKNVSLLHEFLYGTENYQPSSKVVSISGEIASIVGNRQVESNTTWTDNEQDPTTEPNNGETLGTEDGDGVGTGNEDGAETGDGDGAGIGDEDGAGTGDEDGAGTGDEDGAGTGDEDGAGTGDGDGAGTGDGDGAGTGDEDGAGTGDGDGAGTGNEDGAGTGGNQGDSSNQGVGDQGGNSGIQGGNEGAQTPQQ